MKHLIVLVLFSTFFLLSDSLSAQVPPPSGDDNDFCPCVSCIQDINYNCPPCSLPTNTDPGSNAGGGHGGTPNPIGSGGGPSEGSGSFPQTIQWLTCFYDPDCDP